MTENPSALWKGPEYLNKKQTYKSYFTKFLAATSLVGLLHTQPAYAKHTPAYAKWISGQTYWINYKDPHYWLKVVNPDYNNAHVNFRKDLKQAWKSKYPNNVIVYGIWKTWKNSYSWVWIDLNTEHFKWKAEYTTGYKLVWWIYRWDINKNFYYKFWAAHLHLKNYKVGNHAISPSQTTFSWAVWYHNDEWTFNAELWAMAHKLTWAGKYGDTTTHTKYVEIAKRIKMNPDAFIKQVDLTWTYVREDAYDKWRNTWIGNIDAYMSKNDKIHFWIDNNPVKEQFKIGAWILIKFGWNKPTKKDIYVSAWYEHPYKYHGKDKWTISLWYTHKYNIIDEPLYWKDVFEKYTFRTDLAAQSIAPREFEKRVKKSFEKEKPKTPEKKNHAPVIEKITWKTELEVWETTTLHAQASDKDNDKLLYTWKLNWKTYTWQDFEFSATKKWTYKVLLTVSDWKSSVSKSVTITVNKKPEVNHAPIIDSISASKTTITEWDSTNLTVQAHDQDPKDTLTYTWYDENGNNIWTWTSITVTPNKTWNITYTTTVSDWKSSVSKSVTITVNEKEIPNKAPSISISANSNSVTQWDTVTLTANASDPDWTVTSIQWFDSNWNSLWTWASISITENTVWTYEYYAKATDDDEAVTESNHITIKVEAIQPPTVSFEAIDNISSINETDTTITITVSSGSRGFKVRINVTNDGYVEIAWVRYNNGDIASINDRSWGGATMYIYDKDGNLIWQKTIDVQ